MNSKKYSDNQGLLSSLKNGDTDAYDYLYTKYQAQLCLYCRRIITEDLMVQDIVQDAFIKLWLNRRNVSVSPVSYLFRAVYNSAINSIEHRKVIAKYEAHLLAEFYFKTVSQLPDAEVELLNGDIDEAIAKAKACLPPRCLEIFDLSREEGLKNNEISEKLGLSVKSVENQMTIAISRLKRNLGDVLEKLYFLPIFFGG